MKKQHTQQGRNKLAGNNLWQRFVSFKRVALYFIVAFLLIATSVISYLVGQSSVGVAEVFENPYPFISPMRSLVAQEDFVTNLQPLREQIHELYLTEDLEGSMTMYLEILNTGANIIIDPEMRVSPASLLKVPVAMTVLKKIEEGEWALDNKLVLFQEDLDTGYGNEYRNVIGTTFTIEELLKKSLIESDNTTYQILVRNLSVDELADTLDSMGLDDLLDDNYETTVREYSRIFRALYYSSALQRESSEQVLEWMTESLFNNYLQAGLPSEVKLAHKIGEHDKEETYIDSGVVYLGDRPYLISMAVVGKSKEEAGELMGRVSNLIYQYVSNY